MIVVINILMCIYCCNYNYEGCRCVLKILMIVLSLAIVIMAFAYIMEFAIGDILDGNGIPLKLMPN